MEFYVVNVIIILVALIAASYYDIKRKEVPNKITYPLIIAGFYYSLFPWTVLNLFVAGAVFAIGYWCNQKGVLGGGDVKLLTGMILFTPPEFFSISFFLNFFFLSCVCALFYYGMMVLTGKEKLSRGAIIKFAPCIAVGYIVAVASILL